MLRKIHGTNFFHIKFLGRLVQPRFFYFSGQALHTTYACLLLPMYVYPCNIYVRFFIIFDTIIHLMTLYTKIYKVSCGVRDKLKE
jgi:hypothetical protein